MCTFFFQAEDGIRDYKVTGVQTCALPIYGRRGSIPRLYVHPSPALERRRRTRTRKLGVTRLFALRVHRFDRRSCNFRFAQRAPTDARVSWFSFARVARVLSPLECETDPARRAWSIRLHERELYEASVGRGRSHGLLRRSHVAARGIN